MHSLLLQAAVFSVALAVSASAQTQVTLETALNAEYSGKVLTQRRFLRGEKVVYRDDGTAVSRAEAGPWTVDGQIRVQHIALRNSSTLEISGERLLLMAGSGRAPFVNFFDDGQSLRTYLGESQWKRLREHQHVDVDVQRSAGFDESSARAAIGAVFLTPTEHLSDFVPEYWKTALRSLETGERASLDAPASPPKPPSDVSLPRARSSAPPKYNEAARQIRYQGTVVLWVVVDESGSVSDIQIQRALGAGLDDEAAAAVRKWRFWPATERGEPLRLEIGVEVNFHLY
jgi:TonB family protein